VANQSLNGPLVSISILLKHEVIKVISKSARHWKKPQLVRS